MVKESEIEHVLTELLCRYVCKGDVSEVEFLVRVPGMDVNRKDGSGKTPLIHAAYNGF